MDPVEEVLARLRADPFSERAWIQLYQLLAPFVTAAAHRVLGSDHGSFAPDIAQETFVQLTRAGDFSRFASATRLRAYLTTVARSRAYDLLRRERVVDRLDEVEELVSAAMQEEVENTFQADELLLSIRAGLGRADRDLLDRLLLGFSGQEIAFQLEITFVAARVRIHRLRERVERHLGELG